MFGNQTLLCQVVLPVRSCAAAMPAQYFQNQWRRPADRQKGTQKVTEVVLIRG